MDNLICNCGQPLEWYGGYGNYHEGLIHIDKSPFEPSCVARPSDFNANLKSVCPCTLVEPCRSTCSCANSIMSGGCDRCATYGSDEQRLSRAKSVARQLDENMLLRKLLWIRHGCDALYGDDGEMQCNRCMIDFKRDTAASIDERFCRIGTDKLYGDGTYDAMLAKIAELKEKK